MQVIVDKMGLDVILDDLGHQSGQRAPRARDPVKHRLAVGIAGQCALDPLDLSAQSRDTCQEPLLVIDGVHGPFIG